MELEDALRSRPSGGGVYRYEPNVTVAIGLLEQDAHPDYFRLYPNPSRMNQYFLIKKSSVVGKIKQYGPKQEAGENDDEAEPKMVKVRLRTGEHMHAITVETVTIGGGLASGWRP